MSWYPDDETRYGRDADDWTGDDELFRRALGGVAGAEPDPYAARRELEPRLVARRRPGAVWLTAAAALALGLVVAGVNARRSVDGVRVVAPSGAAAGPGPSRVTTFTSTPASTASSIDAEGAMPTSSVAGAANGEADGASSADVGQPASPPASTVETGVDPVVPVVSPTGAPRPNGPGNGNGNPGRGGGPDPTTSPAPPSPPPTGAPTTAHGPAPLVFTCPGGKVTVTFDGQTMHVVAVDPAAGYRYETTKAEPGRIEIRFRGGGGDVRLRLTVEGDVVVPEVK